MGLAGEVLTKSRSLAMSLAGEVSMESIGFQPSLPSTHTARHWRGDPHTRVGRVYPYPRQTSQEAARRSSARVASLLTLTFLSNLTTPSRSPDRPRRPLPGLAALPASPLTYTHKEPPRPCVVPAGLCWPSYASSALDGTSPPSSPASSSSAASSRRPPLLPSFFAALGRHAPHILGGAMKSIIFPRVPFSTCPWRTPSSSRSLHGTPAPTSPATAPRPRSSTRRARRTPLPLPRPRSSAALRVRQATPLPPPRPRS